MSTVAGLARNPGSADGTNSDARFNNPYGVAVDASGNIYVADTGNKTIRELTPDGTGTNWVVRTIAGLAGNSGSADGTNSAARFACPFGIAVDASGNIYVVDLYSYTIREVTPDGTGTNWVVRTVAGRLGQSGHLR
ncbi:MAG: hypothetical protein NTW03_02755 [Verrucomicrobia bacterium]|nr:hypothetical protein [Verrucomicrobiota bacterium]